MLQICSIFRLDLFGSILCSEWFEFGETLLTLIRSGSTSNIRNNYKRRWTFFRVKLVFEFEFEISWSLGPWDPWTFGLLDLFPPPTPPHTSLYISLHPLTSFYLFLLLSSFGMVWLLSSSNILPTPSYSSQLLHPPPKPPPNSSRRVSDD